MLRIIFVITLFLPIGMALAVNPDEMLENPVLETRAQSIGENLRCLVCQNQSIEESDAELARDLRVLVRKLLVAGNSDDEVVSFIVDRYGDFVLLKPPLKAVTLALWFGPGILFGFAGFAGFRFFKKQRSGSDQDALERPNKFRMDS